MCRLPPPATPVSASPLEDSPVHFGETKKSDLAVSISSNLSKAGAQVSLSNVSGREGDPQLAEIVGQERTPMIGTRSPHRIR